MDLVIDFDKTQDKLKLYNILKSLTSKKVIKIESYKKKRSLPQNKYYHSVVLRYISDATGFTVEESHEICKTQFLGYEKKNLSTNKYHKFYKSTTSLNTLEYESYLENIRIWALDFLDCNIPLPNESL